MNESALRDALARWEGYRDRGIQPKQGWGSGGNGGSCALGDISYYAKVPQLSMSELVLRFGKELKDGMRERHDRRVRMTGAYPVTDAEIELHAMLWINQQRRELSVAAYLGLTLMQATSIVTFNDMARSWPINTVKKLLGLPTPAPVKLGGVIEYVPSKSQVLNTPQESTTTKAWQAMVTAWEKKRLEKMTPAATAGVTNSETAEVDPDPPSPAVPLSGGMLVGVS